MKRILILTLTVLSTLALDSEYCALNLSQDDCLKNSGLKNCCWMKFLHDNSFVGQPIEQCFDYKFMVNSLKFLVNPTAYDKMTDKELCTKLGVECDNITLDNFADVFRQAPKFHSDTLIRDVTTIECYK